MLFNSNNHKRNPNSHTSYNLLTRSKYLAVVDVTNDNYDIIIPVPQVIKDMGALGINKSHSWLLSALKQSKKVTVYRDADKDSVAEEQGKEDTGLFGINIHRANESAESKNVDKWSAGCQVLNNPKQFKELIQACIKSGKKSFTYTLLHELWAIISSK